ncbi:MAG: polymerase sigma-70 factor, subfamily [Candidatus Cloacimonadota bacterium]|jgi:RNA polymerase sigma-70 factor (ECF subfamily)|nr:polymerase sigma-70 factor, subfamily [Candidatus Cloacimonadota bacterium]
MNKEKTDCCDLDMIVSDFYQQLKNYLIGKTGDIHLAEDIVQDVMLKVISAHQKSVPVKNLRAWLYQITRNTLIDYYRGRKNKIEAYIEYIDEVQFSQKDDTFSPKEYLIPMIKLLPDKYSIPLLLSDIENKKQAEVAKIINISLSATKMRIQRARKMLYDLFIECCDIQYDKNGSFLHCIVKETCTPLRNLE